MLLLLVCGDLIAVDAALLCGVGIPHLGPSLIDADGEPVAYGYDGEDEQHGDECSPEDDVTHRRPQPTATKKYGKGRKYI